MKWVRKFLIFAILLLMLLAGVAFSLNYFNSKQLLNQQVTKIFANLVVMPPPQVETVYVEGGQLTSKIAALSPVLSLTPTPTPTPVDPYADDPDLKDAAWGEAVQVSDTGYRMKIAYDSVMATATETFQALNWYRYTKGKSNLTWDDRLAKYALERATYICENGSDSHAGFSDYVENQEGYKTLGFYRLGENMSVNMRFTGTHLIEWMYAADEAHDSNQLGDWSHVGVGIFGDCSDLIFGNNMI